MRNAAAEFDDDFDIKAPSRKKASRRSASSAKKRRGKQRFRFNLDMKRVSRYAAIGMSVTVALGIIVNALVLQKARHPAPLFGTSIALVEPNGAPQAAPKMAPPPKVPPLPVAKPADVAPDANDEPAAPPSDQIAQLLQGGVVPSDHPPTKTVLGAQRALAKLGFTVKVTGTFGPQTRKALEQFEKDRHLPVSDELTRRIVKILSAESGIKIER